MFYRWHKVRIANIPAPRRSEFEELGEAVVAQICGRPYTHAAQQTLGVPLWAGDADGRKDALLWLKETHDKAERRHDINESMEVTIIVLVAVEVIFSVISFIQSLWPCIFDGRH
jgi:hypothetical protein